MNTDLGILVNYILTKIYKTYFIYNIFSFSVQSGEGEQRHQIEDLGRQEL